jgi:hypothetical protein
VEVDVPDRRKLAELPHAVCRALGGRLIDRRAIEACQTSGVAQLAQQRRDTVFSKTGFHSELYLLLLVAS